MLLRKLGSIKVPQSGDEMNDVSLAEVNGEYTDTESVTHWYEFQADRQSAFSFTRQVMAAVGTGNSEVITGSSFLVYAHVTCQNI